MIQARGLTKRYGPVVAVDDLTFEVAAGPGDRVPRPERRGQVHHDAADPRAGRADRRLGDVSAGSDYRAVRRPLYQVGSLLESAAIHPGPQCPRPPAGAGRRQRDPRRRVDEVLGLAGLDGVAAKRAGGFSLGMTQRLGIAAALLGDPAVLLLDEPVNGLDPDGVAWIRELLRSLAAEGRTVFVSSHLMSEMAMTADHLIVIGRGRLIADAPLARVHRGMRPAGRVQVRSPQPGPPGPAAVEQGAAVDRAGPGGSLLVVRGLAPPRSGSWPPGTASRCTSC